MNWLRRLFRSRDSKPYDNWVLTKHALEKEVRDRRDSELSLRTNEANYRDQAELLDLTHDAIFVRSMDNKILYWNRAAENLYGWKKEEALGKNTHALLQTRFPKSRIQVEEETMATGSWEGELVHRLRNGTEAIVSSRWALRRDPGGRPMAFLESNRDITARKKNEGKFRNLLESAPDAVVIVDSQGSIQLVNAQTENLFGYSRQELIGKMVEILVPPRFHQNHAAHREGYSSSPHARAMGADLELYGRRKDSTEFPVEISLSPLQTENGTLISSAIRDVSGRRRTEEKIRSLNAELNQRVSELSIANRELEAFSYSVSHDLRAPLRHIDGYTRILKEDYAAELPHEARRYVDRVLEAVNHMGHMVDDLLSLARIGRRELVRHAVNVNNVARDAIAEISLELEGRAIDWLIEPMPEADCDEGLLKLVFTNLFSNAAKFTRERKPAVIAVGACESRGAVAYFVRDNGVGFEPKYADKLFGVFQRLHRQEEFEGTGIGLATVQRIVRRHGGEIWAESAPDCGATFYFTLRPPFGKSESPDAALDGTHQMAHAGAHGELRNARQDIGFEQSAEKRPAPNARENLSKSRPIGGQHEPI